MNKAGGGVRWVNGIIDHVGYQDPSLRKGKPGPLDFHAIIHVPQGRERWVGQVTYISAE